MQLADVPITDAARMRGAGRELLSLALIDARNHTLRWLTAYEQALGARGFVVPQSAEVNPPLWLFGRIGWLQEVWIARNLQRAQGSRCDPSASRLASIEPQADGWYDAAAVAHDARWRLALPNAEQTRQYLVNTLEATLELLERADESDDALYFYRWALFCEDNQGEGLACMAQTLDLDAKAQQGLLRPIAAMAAREPLSMPSTRWQLGSEPGGFVFDNEQGAHEVMVPDFEIDAQPVSWAQYAEFVEDGGYDEVRWWSPQGWAWVDAQSRRCPRYVEQLRGAVLARRAGQTVRLPLLQPVTHLSWYEADAWCRWAERRLPTEVEWELAAGLGGHGGFRYGDVWEWTASTYRAYPGYEAGPVRQQAASAFGTHKVLRGASNATRRRLRHLKRRGHALPQADHLFVGFRSCPL